MITGATGEIGAATADLLASQGARVALGHHPDQAAAAEELAQKLRDRGDEALLVSVDVRDGEAVDTLMREAFEAFGSLDIVVANAGIARKVETVRLSDSEWNDVLDTNLGGVFRSFRSALPRMLASGGGRLLATTSISGALEGWAEHVHYTAGKAGIVGLVRSMALEFAPKGITVNAVAPGLIRSAQSLDAANSLGAVGVEEAAKTIPVGRVGEGMDVAGLFAFLASDEASFITGQTYLVDGGASLGGYA